MAKIVILNIKNSSATLIFTFSTIAILVLYEQQNCLLHRLVDYFGFYDFLAALHHASITNFNLTFILT